jgi:hypothetical protein
VTQTLGLTDSSLLFDLKPKVETEKIAVKPEIPQ